MKIILINGSHRLLGNCSAFIKNASTCLTNNGHDVQSFNLIQLNIHPCEGCLICEDDQTCPLKDDFSALIEPAIKQADLIIMATPTYFNMPSAAMVNFLDRTNQLCAFLSENPKKCILYLSGQTDTSSIMDAYRCMHTYCDIMGMDELTQPFIHVARMPEQTPTHIMDMVNKI